GTPAASVQASDGLLSKAIIASAQVSGKAGQAPHAPLGQRLHQLNHTRPQPLPPPTPHATADQVDQPDVLTDTDGGQWEVTTASGTRYDVDQRRIRRRPPTATAPDSDWNSSGSASHLGQDFQWLPLDTLVWCRRRHPLLALDLRSGTAGRGGYVVSTVVKLICRCPSEDPRMIPAR
ncbi:hypothetical protein ACFUC1_07235, partial [Pedococcus sp. NPDC057267]|uniref:hypothetical protein n=1 Tax=Pedococcus sp. NPDC057267 TaxID=3346077 RepID=UPI00363AE770